MANFLIEMSHTPQQCMQDLDQMVEHSPELLKNTSWGCMAGNHTGWAMVEAGNESDAQNMVPPAIRDQVKITEVQKLTADQIRAMHQMAA